MYQVVSFADSVLFKWINKFLIVFLAMLVLPIVFDIVTLFYPQLNSYVGSWWFYLLFAICMYYIAISGYSNHVVGIVPFQISVFNALPKLVIEDANQSITKVHIEEQINININFEDSKTVISEETLKWKNAIENLLSVHEIYKNPELTLTDVAKKLETNVVIISKAINQNFKMNFNDFINYYRVENVKAAFFNNEHLKSTLLGIAFDSGFNSKATFNRAFKKHVGVSPKDYINTTK